MQQEISSHVLSTDQWNELRRELDDLEKTVFTGDGLPLLASQCYRLTDNSPHVLYNENCPDSLKQQIEEVLLKYAR